MKVIVDGAAIELGVTESQPTISLVDYSRRVTDDFGVTTVVERGFSRRMSVRLLVPFDEADALQRRLADLRARAVEWIADERFESLSFVGFYKDFSLDLAVSPTSFCTLTVEGLAETEAGIDVGGDPASGPNGSTLRLLRPAAITDSTLAAINVPENDYSAWSPGVTYPYGGRVIRAHRRWESIVVANIGNEPSSTSIQWVDLGPTNRWAMFDEALGTLTEASESIEVTLNPSAAVDAIALLDVTAAIVRVQATRYDRTIAPAGVQGMAIFTDMPATSGAITVTVRGPAAVSIGTLMMGSLVGLGVTGESPTSAITDYSRKETDDFGEVTVAERAWAKRMSVRALLRTDAVDTVCVRVATVRAKPCLWIGGTGLEALTIYGFFKDFSIEVGEGVSVLNLSVEGLSKAAPIVPFGATPILVTVFRNGPANQVAPPFDTGEVPFGWSIVPVDLPAGQYRWSTQAQFLVGRQQSPWTDPVKVAGTSWQDVIDDNPDRPMPEDGATNSGDPDSPIGNAGMTIGQFLALQAQAEQDIAALGVVTSGLQSDAADLESRIYAAEGTISTQTTAIAANGSQISEAWTAIDSIEGQLADLTISVRASSNLLPNSTFEQGLSLWSGMSGIFADNADGLGSYLYFGGPYSGGEAELVASEPVKVAAGAAYTVSGDFELIANTPAASIYVDVIYYDAAGAVVLDGGENALTANAYFSDDATRRAQTAHTDIAPAGAVEARVRVIINPNGGMITGAGARRIKFERGAEVSPYSQEASVVQTFKAINSTDLQVASLTSDISTIDSRVTTSAQAISGLESDYASLSSLVATQGASITSNASAISTTNSKLATLDMRVTAGNPNLFRYGGFEAALVGYGVGSGSWFVSSESNLNGRTAIFTNTSGSAIYLYTEAIPGIIDGVNYTATADAALIATTGSFRVDVQFHNAAGTITGYVSGASRQSSFDFGGLTRGLVAASGPAPAESVSARVRLIFENVTGMQGNGVRAVKFERGLQWTPFSSEASIVNSYQSLSTLTTQYASLSSDVSVTGVTVSQQQSAINDIESGLAGTYLINIEAGTGIARARAFASGAGSSWKFESDEFIIASPGGGARTEFSDGNWRVYDANGVLRVRLGVW